MEALALTAEKCAEEGMSKGKIYDEIKNYMIEVIGKYKILNSSKRKAKS